jgi:hypothetical protein
MSRALVGGVIIILLFSFVHVASSNEAIIKILRPHSRTSPPYFIDDNVPVKFEVREPPVLVGYQLDDEETNWFMIKENQIAPAHKGYSDDMDCQAGCDAYLLPGTDIKIAPILTNDNGDFSVVFYIVEGGRPKESFSRDSTSHPVLEIGVDLELFDNYIIYLLNLGGYGFKIASAKKSDFISLTNGSLFEFEVESVTLGEHNLTVFAIDDEGVETSSTTTFAVKVPIAINSNRIDAPAAYKLSESLENFSDTYVFLPGEMLCDYCPSYYNYVFLMGGPEAPKTGNANARYLTEEEQNYLIHTKNATGFWIKPTNFSASFVSLNPEKVIVIAGHTRNETLDAVELFEKEGFEELFGHYLN